MPRDHWLESWEQQAILDFHGRYPLEGYRRLRSFAATPEHIVPGHDPLVMQLYPAVSPELEGIAVRLDVPPKPRPR